jgi:hypothetical protein
MLHARRRYNHERGTEELSENQILEKETRMSVTSLNAWTGSNTGRQYLFSPDTPIAVGVDYEFTGDSANSFVIFDFIVFTSTDQLVYRVNLTKNNPSNGWVSEGNTWDSSHYTTPLTLNLPLPNWPTFGAVFGLRVVAMTYALHHQGDVAGANLSDLAVSETHWFCVGNPR